MISQVTFNRDKWMAALLLDPVTGLDPPGVKVRAAEGIDAASNFVRGYWLWCVPACSDVVDESNIMNLEPRLPIGRRLSRTLRSLGTIRTTCTLRRTIGVYPSLISRNVMDTFQGSARPSKVSCKCHLRFVCSCRDHLMNLRGSRESQGGFDCTFDGEQCKFVCCHCGLSTSSVLHQFRSFWWVFQVFAPLLLAIFILIVLVGLGRGIVICTADPGHSASNGSSPLSTGKADPIGSR